jgi:hypothetical protein
MDRATNSASRHQCALLCALLLLIGGCSPAAKPPTPLEQQVCKLVQLPGIRGSAHPQLATELQQVEAQQQLPAQLDAAIAPGTYEPFVAPFPDISRPTLQREVNALWPRVALRLEPGALQKAREQLQQQAPSRAQFQRAIQQTGARPQLRLTDALLAGDDWLDAIQVGCRLEGLAAADILAEHQPDAAVLPLERILRVARQLDREPHLNARLLAAELRADAAQVLHAIANHPATTITTLQRLQELLLAQLTAWPSDERILITERAHGLLVYELVRAGNYVQILPIDQRTDLQRKGILATSARAALADVDADELFYLRAMQLQITAAKAPYYQRLSTLENLRTELQTRSASGEFPLVAGSLLLPKSFEIHQRLAADRARCEGWVIVLTTVCERPLGSPPPCPLTGQAYDVQTEQDRIRIANLSLREGETIEVLRPGLLQARRRAAGFDLLAPTRLQ